MMEVHSTNFCSHAAFEKYVLKSKFLVLNGHFREIHVQNMNKKLRKCFECFESQCILSESLAVNPTPLIQTIAFFPIQPLVLVTYIHLHSVKKGEFRHKKLV